MVRLQSIRDREVLVCLTFFRPKIEQITAGDDRHMLAKRGGVGPISTSNEVGGFRGIKETAGTLIGLESQVRCLCI